MCGFDDIPVARHLSPQLTSVRQPIQDLGATAFETLHAMIGAPRHGDADPRGRDIVLPTSSNCRESCGCGPPWRAPGGHAAAGGPARHATSIARASSAFYLVTAIVAVSLDFFIPRLIPGNPVDAVLAKMQGATITKATIAALELQFGSGSKASLWAQYTHYWSTLLHGNLGISTSNGFEPVTSVIGAPCRGRSGLVGIGDADQLRAGHPARRARSPGAAGTWLDNLLPVTTFLQAAPYFFLAFLVIDLFSTKLGWFPSGGAHGRTWTSRRWTGPTSATCSTTPSCPR